MNRDFFKQQIDRLRGIYSPGALNEERIDIWWRQFKDVPNHVFESALNHVIAESTTQALPAMSRIAEAVGFFRNNQNGASMQVLESPHACEKCRDFGFFFHENTVVRCKCEVGLKLNPDVLAKQQKSYDRGNQLFRIPARFEAPQQENGSPQPAVSPFKPLPYDPNERITDRSDEWV